eukprot:scaffold22245_cov135-Isochrysis_galbana.AAC.2
MQPNQRLSDCPRAPGLKALGHNMKGSSHSPLARTLLSLCFETASCQHAPSSSRVIVEHCEPCALQQNATQEACTEQRRPAPSQLPAPG